MVTCLILTFTQNVNNFISKENALLTIGTRKRQPLQTRGSLSLYRSPHNIMLKSAQVSPLYKKKYRSRKRK
jgi:hypothetical protein